MGSQKPGMEAHSYAARLIWDGNLGGGTANYTSYSRAHRVLVSGKPDLSGSADAAFRGDPERHNPEDLFIASIAACHMLSYLSLCARQGIRVMSYEDDVCGTLRLYAGRGGKFEEVTLRPTVTIAEGCDAALAIELHDTAHKRCFIANSCSVPIRHVVTVHRAGAS